MRREFKTALTRSGNFINPDRIIVTDETVIWKKRNKFLIGVDSKSIPISRIASVEINNKGFGTDVIITSYGAGEIIGRNLTIWDAKELKRIIENLIG